MAAGVDAGVDAGFDAGVDVGVVIGGAAGVGVGMKLDLPPRYVSSGRGQEKKNPVNINTEVATVRRTNAQARNPANSRMSEPLCLTNPAKTTKINISPSITIGPKTANFRSFSKPTTIATAAAIPANPKAYLTAGTACVASLNIAKGFTPIPPAML